MKVLSNIPIVAKMMLVVALMGVLSLSITAYNSFETAKLDSSYSHLTDKLFPALVKLARANRNISALMYAGYRAVAYDGSSAEGKHAGADGEKASKSAHKLFAEARTLAPEKASQINAFEERFRALDAIVTEATRLGLANDNAAAAALLQRADKQASALTTEMAAFNDAVIAETDRLSDENSASASKAMWIEWGGGIAGLILASATAIWLVRAQVSGPLLRLSDRMTALANGKLDVEIDGAERGDEVGRMARSVLVFKENGLKLKAAEADAERQAVAAEEQRRKAEAEREAAARALAQVVEALAGGLAAVADGDLTAELGANFASEYERLRNDFNAAVGKLRDTLGVINTAGEGIRAGAGEISQASDDLSRRTEQQAASLEETAAALDEITATVRRTAEAAQQARSVVAGAKNDAEQTEHVVKEAVGAMGQIEASSRQISTIIGVIDEIAFQTNLLALNAGVEAARAGDAGKGFAVVASEVRALAQRSAEAAKEIKDLISTSGAQVTAGVELVGSAGEALSRILRHVTDINGLVGEIAASAQEQASGLQQVNTAVNQMDQVTQQNAAMVEEATAAARSLSDESRNMSDLIARFRLNGHASIASAPRAVVQLRPSQQAKPDTAPSAEAAADWTEF